MLAVREARRLPAASSRAIRVAFGILTFLLWYLGMLSVMGILAVLTVRKVRDVGFTIICLLALTAAVGWVRRAVRPAQVLADPSQPSSLAREEPK